MNNTVIIRERLYIAAVCWNFTQRQFHLWGVVTHPDDMAKTTKSTPLTFLFQLIPHELVQKLLYSWYSDAICHVNNSLYLAWKHERIFFPQISSVLRRKKFCESEARANVWALRKRSCRKPNIQAYFPRKKILFERWRLNFWPFDEWRLNSIETLWIELKKKG